MRSTKKIVAKNSDLVMRVCFTETVQKIKPGTAWEFKARDTCTISGARQAASRLNRRAGWTEYSVQAVGNGEGFIVSRGISQN